jgi:hypothetical protein
MSRPRKIHPPLKSGFNEILSAVAMGQGTAKKAFNKAGQVGKLAALKPPAQPKRK